jgi:hypothetical protein
MIEVILYLGKKCNIFLDYYPKIKLRKIPHGNNRIIKNLERLNSTP